MSSRELLNKQEFLIQGEVASFEVVFKKYYPRLKKYCLGMVKDYDVAEDLVQDAFLKVWEKRQTVLGDNGLQALLYTMVRNNALNYLKRNKLRDQYVEAFRFDSPQQELFIRSFLEEDEWEAQQTLFKKELERLLEALPEKCKEAFVLSRFDGLTNTEVADYMGVSVKTVEKHLSKATAILRKLLDSSPVRSFMTVWIFVV